MGLHIQRLSVTRHSLLGQALQGLKFYQRIFASAADFDGSGGAGETVVGKVVHLDTVSARN